MREDNMASFRVLAVLLCLLIVGNFVESAPTCSVCDEESQRVVNEIHFLLSGPRDCTDISGSGKSKSDLYKIVAAGKPVQVYCDMKHPGGGWLVFQRRMNGKENFYRGWAEYQEGFGNVEGEFWLGNELLHRLTNARKYKLRIDMMDFAGAKRYAEYSSFSVGSSASGYQLSVGGFTGDAGDSFSGHNGAKFSTKDDDRDVYTGGSCAQLYKGAWWYTQCHASNLNGIYHHGKHDSYADGVNWQTWLGYHVSLKFTEMKIAPAF